MLKKLVMPVFLFVLIFFPYTSRAGNGATDSNSLSRIEPLMYNVK